MATAYDFISANKRRSVFLIGIFILLFGAVGYAVERFLGTGPIAIVAALGLSVASAYIGYYTGDQIALRASGARGPLTKAENSYLYNMVENLTIAEGLPMPKLYIITDSAINAFATGRDPQHASIAVTTGAIEQLENEELQGVLAHELSHIKNYDIRFMTLVTVLVGSIALLSHFAVRANMFGRRRSDSENNQANAIIMILGLLLIILAPIAAQLVQLAVSRKREFLADASGALMTRYPAGLANALQKIEASARPMQNANSATAPLFFSSPFGTKKLSSLFSTHPPVAERITALRKMGA